MSGPRGGGVRPARHNGGMSLLLRNGTVHSVGDPFATAVLVEDGTIAWIGEESTADTMRSGTVVDLDGLLLTPAFADAWAPAADPREAPALGIAAAHVPAGTEQTDDLETTELVLVGDRAHAGTPAILAAGAQEVAVLLAALGPGHPVGAVMVTDTGELAAVLAELAADRPAVGAQLRIHLPGDLALTAGEVEAIAASHAAVVTCAGAEGFALPLADLVAAGIPVAFGSGAHEWAAPWATIAAAMTTGPAPLTARAAFNAHARQVWRLGLPSPYPRGTIAVGAPAAVAAWEVETLAIQAPNANIAAWSTDTRAGTPLLPALGPGETPPVHAFTVTGGRVTSWNERILPRPA